MKAKLFLAIAIVAAGIAVLTGYVRYIQGTEFAVQQTISRPYKFHRLVGSDDTLIALSTNAGNFGNKPATAEDVGANYASATATNSLQLVFAGTDSDGKTFSWTLYAWRASNGPCELVADGTGTLGTQDVVAYPGTGTLGVPNMDLWADTLTVTNDYWLGPVLATTGGHNNVAKVTLDFSGYRWFVVYIDDLDGVGECTSVTVYYSYF